ncbi:hypothetical protein FHETE_11247 [Fusarium heterosporum]|uniref:Uncharacterized protein n=1 Tax=Fusarium heterosporum TaxID=42747 RepID=A0A8H5SQ73_FUSHE|nr:hypothetical protein FHETE_11247 [Fusarium heterosporum]
MTTLPDELWQCVFSTFEDRVILDGWKMYGIGQTSKRATLSALCRVCRQFGRIAQPLLYRTIFVDEWQNYGTLIENPQLGEQIRSCSLSDDTGMKWTENKLLGWKDTRELVFTALRHLNLSSALVERMRKSLTRGFGIVALCAAFMPNLNRVSFRIDESSSPAAWMLCGTLGLEEEIASRPYHSEDEWEDEESDDDDDDFYEDSGRDQLLPSCLKGALANYGFQHLTEVWVKTIGSQGGNTPAWVIEPLFLHPTLKTLRTLGIDWYDEEHSRLKWPERESNLEYLYLEEVIIDASGFQSILQRCQKLKGITVNLADWQRKGASRESYEDWLVDLDGFGNALRLYGQGLELFDLRTADYDRNIHSVINTDFDDYPNEGRLGSLQTLTSLRHLKITEAQLLGVEERGNSLTFSKALPDSIETLHLHMHSSYHAGQHYRYDRDTLAKALQVNRNIHALLLEGKMPRLREIQIERHSGDKFTNKCPAELRVEGWDAKYVDETRWQKCLEPGRVNTIITLSKR